MTATTTQITPILLTAIRPELAAALAAVGEKFGVTFDIGKFTYDPRANNFVFKTEAVGAGGLSKDAVRLNANSPLLGLPPNCAMKRASIRTGKGIVTGVLVGCNTTGSKAMFQHDSDGKTYLYGMEQFAKLVKFEDAELTKPKASDVPPINLTPYKAG